MKDFWQKVTTGFLCDCGKKHFYESRVYDEDVLSGLLKVMPEGTHAVFVGDDAELKKRLNKIYRITTPRGKEFDYADGQNAEEPYGGCRSQSAALDKRGGGRDLSDGGHDFCDAALPNPEGEPAQNDFFGHAETTYFPYDDCGEDIKGAAGGRTKVKRFEDVRLVIGQGRGVPYAKYIAKNLGIKLAIVGLADFSPYALVTSDGFTELIRSPQPYIVLGTEPDEETLASCFAYCALTALSLFEWEFSSGAETCPAVFFEALRAVEGLVDTVKRRARQSAVVREAVLDCCLRLGVLSGVLDAPRLSINGAVQTAAVLRRLFLVESGGADNLDCEDADELRDFLADECAAGLGFDSAPAKVPEGGAFVKHAGKGGKPASGARDGRTSGGLSGADDFLGSALVLGSAVARSYAAFLARPIGFSCPPDNILRTDRLSSFLGITETRAVKMRVAYRTRAEDERADYILGLNRNALLCRITSVIRLLDESVFLFFKLLPDGGFRFKNYADSLEVSLSLGLGADVLPFDTLLKAMRDKGVLDKFIL